MENRNISKRLFLLLPPDIQEIVSSNIDIEDFVFDFAVELFNTSFVGTKDFVFISKDKYYLYKHEEQMLESANETDIKNYPLLENWYHGYLLRIQNDQKIKHG